MIWHRGAIIPDHALRISALDRSFEHGLGLFETFRTWSGIPTLLSLHLARIKRSAHALGLPLEDDDLPDARAVIEVITANAAALSSREDVRLRLTLTGGLATTPASESTLWMTASRLPPPGPEAGLHIARTIQVADDVLARHKTLNYWRQRIAHADAVAAGYDDVLCVSPDGLICETTRANIFFVEGRRLVTPGTSGTLLPGIMRAVVLQQAAQLGLSVCEEAVPLDRIKSADEAFLTSSLRGMLPLARLLGRTWPVPGRVTHALWDATAAWLHSGGTSA